MPSRDKRHVLVALVAAILLAPAASSRAASTTTIGFEGAPANTQITTGYQSEGVTFGKPSILGFTSPPGDALLTRIACWPQSVTPFVTDHAGVTVLPPAWICIFAICVTLVFG